MLLVLEIKKGFQYPRLPLWNFSVTSGKGKPQTNGIYSQSAAIIYSLVQAGTCFSSSLDRWLRFSTQLLPWNSQIKAIEQSNFSWRRELWHLKTERLARAKYCKVSSTFNFYWSQWQWRLHSTLTVSGPNFVSQFFIPAPIQSCFSPKQTSPYSESRRILHVEGRVF